MLTVRSSAIMYCTYMYVFSVNKTLFKLKEVASNLMYSSFLGVRVGLAIHTAIFSPLLFSKGNKFSSFLFVSLSNNYYHQ